MGLNPMKELDRFAGGRNPVVPPTGHMARRVEQQYAVGERIAPAEVIEEPTVQLRAQVELALNVEETLAVPGRHVVRILSPRWRGVN
jgi:hypothetical protein